MTLASTPSLFVSGGKSRMISTVGTPETRDRLLDFKSSVGFKARIEIEIGLRDDIESR